MQLLDELEARLGRARQVVLTEAELTDGQELLAAVWPWLMPPHAADLQRRLEEADAVRQQAAAQRAAADDSDGWSSDDVSELDMYQGDDWAWDEQAYSYSHSDYESDA